MKRIIIIGIIVIIAVVGVVFVRLFIVGNPMSPDVIGQIKVNVSDSEIQVNASFVLASAMAYTNRSYRIEGSKLYIKVYGTLVSAIYPSGIFEIKIKGDFADIREIYFEDNSNEKLIWNKNN